MAREAGRPGEPVLLEGPHLLADALDAGLELEATLATPEFLESGVHQDLLERLERPPLAVDPRLLDELADADSPRGLVAVAWRSWTELGALEGEGRGVYVFADGIQDPGNVGALGRVAEAAGVAALVLGEGCAAPGHPRTLRASAGSLLRLPVVAPASAHELDEHLNAQTSQAERPTWVKLLARGGESLYDPAAMPEGGALVLAVGAEGGGLSADVEALAGLELTIPMEGRLESLNATVAAAVVLFEWRRRRR